MKLFYVNASLFQEGMNASEMRVRLLRLCRKQKVYTVAVSGVSEDNLCFNDFKRDFLKQQGIVYVSNDEAVMIDECVLTPESLITRTETLAGLDDCGYLVDLDMNTHLIYYLYVCINPMSCFISTIQDELENILLEAKHKKGKS